MNSFFQKSAKFVKIFILLIFLMIAELPLQQTVVTQSFEEYAFENSTFVGVGRFTTVVENKYDIPLLVNRQVVTVFVPSNILKSPDNEGLTSTEVIVDSDMLVFPGENISRYSKRQAEMDRVRPRFLLLYEERQELKNNYENGIITESDYTSQLELIEPELNQLSALINNGMTVGIIGTTSGRTFYERGGAISPETEFLVFLNSDESGNYRIGPADNNSFIFWGEQLEERLSNLREL